MKKCTEVRANASKDFYIRPVQLLIMPVEIFAVGGYNEVGKNMTAIKVNNTMVVCDMGIHIENYIKLTEDEDLISVSGDDLINAGAAPNIGVIEEQKSLVKAIIPTHAHLDHVGAIPFLSNNFNATIICTPFTASVINAILKDERIRIKNPIKRLNTNSVYNLNQDVKIEFINITHSTPQTVMVALHTPEGIILYANDFKFDKYPTLGKQPNFNRLQELGRKGILALIVDSTYANEAKKMPSESVAKEMLRDVMLGTNSKDKMIIATTFSSHLARLKSIIEFGKRLNRKVLFLGRSLSKYVRAGEEVGIINFSKDVEIIKYSKQIKKRLRKISPVKRKKYLLVVTGHQGEPKSTLSKMVDGKLDFTFNPEDHVIFSCNVIPTETNRLNRALLEKKLRDFGVRIFKDIHVSGHAAREDLRDLINLVKPKHIIPAHGTTAMTSALSDLAAEMGYLPEKTVHVTRDGQTIMLEL